MVFIIFGHHLQRWGRKYFAFSVHTVVTRGAGESLAELEGNKLQQQKILMFIYPIYNHTWRNISTIYIYRGADKSLARPGRKQATATVDFEFYISYL
jgi:hypothetical protein